MQKEKEKHKGHSDIIICENRKRLVQKNKVYITTL